MKELSKVYAVMFFVILICGFADYASAECSDAYFKVGAGYKFVETDELTVNGVDRKVDYTDPISARFEIAKECGNITFGVAHHSQWATGAPFNDRKEYAKTEFFIDYKFSLGF